MDSIEKSRDFDAVNVRYRNAKDLRANTFGLIHFNFNIFAVSSKCFHVAGDGRLSLVRERAHA